MRLTQCRPRQDFALQSVPGHQRVIQSLSSTPQLPLKDTSHVQTPASSSALKGTPKAQ